MDYNAQRLKPSSEALPARYDTGIPATTLRSPRTASEAEAGRCRSFDPYTTTNRAMNEWTRVATPVAVQGSTDIIPVSAVAGKVHGQWDRCWFRQY